MLGRRVGLATDRPGMGRHEGPGRQRPELPGQVGDPVTHARDRLLLALEDVDLAFHERRPARRREERREGLGEVLGRDLAPRPLELRQALFGGATPRVVASRFGAGLPDEQRDLVEFLAQPPRFLGQLRRQARLDVRGGLVGSHQSSGMRIQPCFMA